MTNKLAPGECTAPEDGSAICNIDGELVERDLGGNSNDEVLEATSPDSFGDKIAKAWNKMP